MYLGLNIKGATPDLQALLKADVMAFDTETIGLQPNACTLLGFSCASKDNGAFYFPWGGSGEGAPVLGMLGDNRVPKLAHNASFDRSVLKAKSGVCVDNVIDTMIAAHMANEPVLALKPLVAHWVEGHPRITQFSELKKPIGSMTFTELCAYSGPHSYYLFPLWAALKQKLVSLGSYKAFMDLEMPFLPVLSDMELNGACVDTGVLTNLGRKFSDELDYLQGALDHYSGIPNINYNSPQQVAELLYDKLKLPVWKLSKATGSKSTDADSLERLKGKHPVVNLILLYRQYRKLKGTYVDGTIERMIGNRIYTTFNQTGTRTGRLSSTDPNLQNIPMRRPEGRQIRRAFVAPPGCKLMKVDFDQMELRMMAHWSQDPLLLDAFREGRDIHVETAIRMFGDPERRFDGKTMNFCLPLHYAALTKAGWKGYGELREGEDILAYDPDTRLCAWTPARGIYYFESAPLIEIGNAHSKFECTPNHRWCGRQRGWERHPAVYKELFKTAEEISRGPGTSEFEVIISAPCQGGGSPISPDEARIIAWLYTDGTVKWSKLTHNTSQSYGAKRNVYAVISQKKQPFLDEIRALVTREHAQTGKESPNNTGTTRIFLNPQYVRNLWDKANLHKLSLDMFVLSLTPTARFAFLDTMVKAEGCSNRGIRGNVLAQNTGEVLRAMSLAIFMEGYFPRVARHSDPKYPLGRQVTLSRPTIGSQRFTRKQLSPAPVWCVSTDFHTWVVRDMRSEGDRIFITGNTIIFGGGDYEVARQTGLPLSVAKKRRKQWLDVYKGVKAFMDLAAKDYPEVGYAQTLFGRVRVIPELFSDNPSVRMHGVREALSTVIQGSCAEVMKLGMTEAWKALKRIGTRMILQVHDELVLEVPTDCLHDTVTVLRKTMPYLDLSVPLTVTTSVGDNWLDMQEVKPA